MNDPYLRKVMTTTIFAILLILSFFLLKPIFLSIVVSLILAFVFNPVYNVFYKIIKSKNVAAGIICLLLILLIVIPAWFITPIIIDQSFKIFLASQQMDFVTPLRDLFPALFTSEQFSTEIVSIVQSFAGKITNSLMNSLSQLIFNFPTLFLQASVVIFSLFFILRDKDKLLDYIKSILPFSKEVEEKLFKSSEGITISVIYGQVIVGMLQGVIVGIGFFVFNVPNALLLTFLAVLAGIFPIIGTALIWVPVVIYLALAGNSSLPAIGVALFGLFSSTIDNFLRPMIVSKRTDMHPALVLIGMIGGVLFLGILGFILGPLILAYLLIVLDLYRDKKSPIIFVEKGEKTS